ncbi:MAG: amino acid adenylation domain-containing protein [Myxococcales bacterium]
MSDQVPMDVDFDPFAQGEISQTAPLTTPQRELWSAVQLGGDEANCAYNEGVTLTFKGALDVAALGRSLNALVARHESLRSNFSADGRTMVIQASGQIEPSIKDLRDASDLEAAYDALVHEEIITPFDLGDGPLLRAVLVRTGANEQRLLLVAHHIVCDGWSFGVLLSELAAFYTADKSGQSPALEPAPSYAAYASERFAREESADGKRVLRYWRSQYEGSIPSLDLPLDRQRPALRTYASRRYDHTLSPDTVAKLRELAKREAVTLQHVLLLGFSTLLARLTQQWDLVVGLSAAGQASSEQFGLVGHCVNYLPLRVKLGPELSFREGLKLAKRTMLDALDHSECSFGALLAELPIARDPSRIPLSPVSFNLEQGVGQLAFAGLEVKTSVAPRAYEPFEMFANLVDHKQHIVVETQYNSDLFDEASIRDWLETYETLLLGAIANSDTKLHELPVHGPTAQGALDALNATQVEYEVATPIHAFFERQVDALPSATALLFEGKSQSYVDLENASNRLAHALRARGIGPESIVGVCVPRSLDMVAALLGVLKSGAAYLPLDPNYPRERLKYMLEDSGAKLVVASGEGLALVQDTGVGLVTFDDAKDESNIRPAAALEPHSVAYVIYTSGSTGKPKGVLVEHHNFANFLRGMDERLSLAKPGIWLSATSIGFDISVLEIFGSLARGFTVLLHSDASTEEHQLPALLERHAVTHFQCTPSQARLLLGDPTGKRGLGKLREMMVGGEGLPADLADELLSAIGSGRLVNMYGPTETTIWSTTQHIADTGTGISIGRPIANTQVHLVDAWGASVPRGAVGELCIGGSGVTRGYHQREDLTRARFVEDKLSEGIRNGRLYKTGDLGRVRSDGLLELLGRNDDQVKIRGYRIELGEIETSLRAYAGVREAAVVVREERPGDKRLIAYLVCADQAEAPKVGELRGFLGQLGLPDYMFPQVFMPLAALPRTPNGKLDKRALPAPDQSAALSAGTYQAPSDDLEQRIAAAWAQVLALGRVGVTDNFFDLGGHSLLVVRLANAITESVGKRVAPTDIFRFSTVRGLAEYLRAGGGPSGRNEQAVQRASDRQAALRAKQGRRG